MATLPIFDPGFSLGSVYFQGSGGPDEDPSLVWDDTDKRLVLGTSTATKRGRLHVAHLTSPASERGGILSEGPVACGVDAGAGSFGSASPYVSMILGSVVDGAPFGVGGQGGLYAVARSGAAGVPPTNAPYVGLSCWDWGDGLTGVDQGRTLYYGGGGWAAPDCTSHQFYTSDTYTETTDTGLLRFGITNSLVYVREAQFRLEGDISSTFSTSQNNWNPAGLSTAQTIRATASAAALSITGLAGGGDGRIIILHNVGATNSFTLVHQSTSSSAANRFALPGATDVVIPTDGSVTLRYDASSSRWRLLAKAL
jgi:hypothetical protein